MMKSGVWSLLASAALFVLVAGSAHAGQPLTLLTDKSMMITLAGEPSTVVVGNPSIADISLNGKQVFLHGHAYGETSITILDKDGNMLADFELSVSSANANSLVVFKGGAAPTRFSYTCAPYCEASMQPGDNPSFFEDTLQANAKKNALATGKPTAEATAPAAPQ